MKYLLDHAGTKVKAGTGIIDKIHEESIDPNMAFMLAVCTRVSTTSWVLIEILLAER